VAMWKDFPRRFCAAHGLSGFVFSRPGYGRSTPRPANERWAVDFMHRQAEEVLPALFAATGIDRPWLFGHSDGGSIALIHAGAHDRVRGLVLLAPHVFVEDLSVASIAEAKTKFATTDLAEKLSRHHRDAAGTFWGWNNIWLHPDFRRWNIEEYLPRITCPILAIQGVDDRYGTMAQVQAIARQSGGPVEILALAECRHSPQRDQPDAVLAAIAKFVKRIGGNKSERSGV